MAKTTAPAEDTTGLVQMRNKASDEILFVHPTCVDGHVNVGFEVVE